MADDRASQEVMQDSFEDVIEKAVADSTKVRDATDESDKKALSKYSSNFWRHIMDAFSYGTAYTDEFHLELYALNFLYDLSHGGFENEEE